MSPMSFARNTKRMMPQTQQHWPAWRSLPPAVALRTRSPILVEENVIDSAKTVDFNAERTDSDRLQKWLESLDPEELGKYKM